MISWLRHITKSMKIFNSYKLSQCPALKSCTLTLKNLICFMEPFSQSKANQVIICKMFP